MTDANRPRFDPTINLGHILTALMMVSALTAGWAALDRRLTRVEGDNERQTETISRHELTLGRLDAAFTRLGAIEATMNQLAQAQVDGRERNIRFQDDVRSILGTIREDVAGLKAVRVPGHR